MTPLYKQSAVVVTGGSGFIGSHLIDALADRGARVVNIDIKSPRAVPHGGVWRSVNLLDETSLSSVLQEVQPRLVYNLAAHASLAGGREAMAVNVEGVRNLLKAIARMDAKPLLVHASTQLVAGAATGDFDPTAYMPYGLYGESKAESERLVWGVPGGAPRVVVRPSNIWGPWHPTFARAIWRYIRLGLYMHPTGPDPLRSYGFVGNVVQQLIRIAEVDPGEVEGRTFYLGDTPVPSTQWLDGFSLALIGRPVRRVPFGLLKMAALGGELSGKLGGPSPINLGRLQRMTADFPVPMAPTEKILGMGPYTLAEGIKKTVHWLNEEVYS